MNYAYWQQWDSDDLDSWQGKDYHDHDDDLECEDKDSEDDDQNNEYPCCGGRGCNDCLGLEY